MRDGIVVGDGTSWMSRGYKAIDRMSSHSLAADMLFDGELEIGAT